MQNTFENACDFNWVFEIEASQNSYIIRILPTNYVDTCGLWPNARPIIRDILIFVFIACRAKNMSDAIKNLSISNAIAAVYVLSQIYISALALGSVGKTILCCL